MKIGKIQTLEVSKKTEDGFFLEDEAGQELFISKLFVEDNIEEGDELQVFIYQEKGQPKATVEMPYCQVGEYAVMEAVQVLPSGAFMDWGIIKDLFIPFKKQQIGITEGRNYLVYVYLDEETGLLTGTTKFKKTGAYENLPFKAGDRVDLIIVGQTNLGWNVLINKKYFGLVYSSEVFKRLMPLTEEIGYIKTIREDGKIDVSLQPEGYEHNDVYQEKILELLQKRSGLIYLSDKSAPEEIKRQLQMSKKNFKKAIGGLYKSGLIDIQKDRILLK